jgi:hypothetical protein
MNIHQMLEKFTFNDVNRKNLQVTTKTSNLGTDMLCMSCRQAMCKYDKVEKKDSKPNSQTPS